MLVFGLPDIREPEIEEVVDTLRSGWIGTGPKTKRFEALFAEYADAAHAVAVNSCTAGLHLALSVAGIGPGDEVITTALTFTATANVIIHCGATPVFVDIDPSSHLLLADAVDRAVTPRTRAVIPVHLYGHPCEMGEIMQVARDHSLAVIEDAAHAVEASIDGRKVGSIGDATVFSFYATKNLVTAEGGMITTQNADWAAEMRIRSLHGLSNDAWKRYSGGPYTKYETLFPGFKYNMTDIQSSLGLHQLARINENLAVRERIWQRYDRAFDGIAGVSRPRVSSGNIRHGRHLYTIQIDPQVVGARRDDIIAALRYENIGSGVHFTALHLHPYYQENFGFSVGDFPVAERVGERTLSLPLSSAMSDSDADDVIAALLRVLQYYSSQPIEAGHDHPG